jgi:5-methylcytosine-specific restriction endonuclease McrA
MTRECRYCGEVKPLEDFVKAPKCRYGRSHQCKACDVARIEEWSDENLDRVRELRREQARRLAHDHPMVAHSRAMRVYAKRRGAEIVEDVIALVVLERDDGVCGICGEDVDPLHFTIDHIVGCPDGGEHSYANVQLAHRSCNSRKGNAEWRARRG